MIIFAFKVITTFVLAMIIMSDLIVAFDDGKTRENVPKSYLVVLIVCLASIASIWV